MRTDAVWRAVVLLSTSIGLGCLLGWQQSVGAGPRPEFDLADPANCVARRGPEASRSAPAAVAPTGTKPADQNDQQPGGALTGRIVYTHAGHGWTAENQGDGHWFTQRGNNFSMVEDLGNQDQMTLFVEYLFRAGATVVPLRPVGHQTNEVVLDNDDKGVAFVGAWKTSRQKIFFGNAHDVPCRWIATSGAETAHARYRPRIPETGFYPVYTWVAAGGDRASDQLYRIHHTGGTTEVNVNHRRVGNGLVYLGTYFFHAGTDGYVDISNRSRDSGKIVVADMIRFGNGMGDIDRGGGVSGHSREDEAGLYWVKWHVDHAQGISDSRYRASPVDRSATVSLAPRYAAYMNQEQDGVLGDRVFVSFHSNAGGGEARGVLGLCNGNNRRSSATPNQLLLAKTLAKEVNDDLVARSGQYEHAWVHRSTITLDRGDIEFGEINNEYINNEFDATIVETGFHDNQLDAKLLRDPRVRDAIARATCQGVFRYFHALQHGTSPIVMPPGPVTGLHAKSAGVGTVTLSWIPPVANAYDGDAATAFRIEISTDGHGFGHGVYVAGGQTTSYTLTSRTPDSRVRYFRMAAVNAGGESKPSEVVAALPRRSSNRILIVNGFDRCDRFLDPRQPYRDGTIDRVWPRQSNSRDYVVQVAEAIAAVARDVSIDSTSNEAVVAGRVKLTDYRHVFWILGEESTADHTFDKAEQRLATSFLAGGGNLFASGTEIGWDLDHEGNGREFYRNQLHAAYVSDAAGTYRIRGAAGGILHGLSFTFDNGTMFYDAEYADTIRPLDGAVAAARYENSENTAAVQFAGAGGSGRVVLFAFPFETITEPMTRRAVMARVLDFFRGQVPAASSD